MYKHETNLSGTRLGRLLILSRYDPDPHDKDRVVRWNCLCDCGNTTIKTVYQLLAGRTTSCGCYVKERTVEAKTTHGLNDTKMYNILQNMKSRCYNKNNQHYELYGGRGIKICDRWLQSKGEGLLNFVEDMGECPGGMSLDRIDVNGDYTPENCRWAIQSIQCFNQNQRKDNTSGRVGVYWVERLGKYQVNIAKDSKSIYIGVFTTFEQAVKAREDAELTYYGFTKGK